ncbi:MAG: hypothetical protein ACE5KJ_04975 [Candidatus Zixiibacteriota bacterium]
MPQAPEPVGRRPVWDRQTPTKFERIFSYCVILIVVLLGILILAGAFGISSQFRGIIGVMLIGYGLIRFLSMKTRFERHRERGKEGLREEDKEGNETLRS